MGQSSTKAVMIDIETLDTTPSAVVIQIAAVVFSYTAKGVVKIGKEIDYKLSVAPQLKLGRTISADTLKFWLNTPQQQALLGELLAGGADCMYLFDTIVRDVFHSIAVEGVSEVWTQGPTFDIGILENIASQTSSAVPWKFYQVRDLRTVQKFVGDDKKSIEMKKANSNHNALDDCHSQIKLLQHFIKKANK